MKSILCAAIAVLMCTNIYAEAILKTDADVKIEAINDKQLNSGLLQFKNKDFLLEQGEHIVVVRYSGYFEEQMNMGSHEIIKSEPVQIKTPILKNKQIYELKLLSQPKNIDEARLFAKSPQIGLYTADGQLIAQSDVVTKQVYSNKNTVFKALGVTKTATANASSVNNKPVVTSSASLNEKNSLIDAWKNATPYERQQLLNLITQ